METLSMAGGSKSTARNDFAGRTAIITGSTSGIGLGIARSLAVAGMNVVLNGFGTATDINKTRDDLAKIYDVSVTYSAADMSKPEQIEQMVEDASRIFGQVGILVNNAGILHAGPVEVTPPSTWDSIMAINLSAVFHAIRTVLPGMKAQRFGALSMCYRPWAYSARRTTPLMPPRNMRSPVSPRRRRSKRRKMESQSTRFASAMFVRFLSSTKSKRSLKQDRSAPNRRYATFSAKSNRQGGL